MIDDLESGDIKGARYYNALNMLKTLSYKTLIIGEGEGEGWWSSHNAYLIVLYENGVWSLLSLIGAGILMFLNSFKKAVKSLNFPRIDHLALASVFIVISWFLMIGINWAQLNQSFPWIFLAIAVMSTKPDKVVAS